MADAGYWWCEACRCWYKLILKSSTLCIDFSVVKALDRQVKET